MSESLPQRRYFPQLEGMRGVAALGVMTTHVAFHTRTLDVPVLGPILGRLDLAVALFFALSGFLLWRPYVTWARYPQSARAARRPSVLRYLRHRVVRIWPAYVVVVIVVFTLLPQAAGADLTVWLANLTLTQIYVPLTLAPGLTQMWSLSVEVGFYALLPVIGYALIGLRGPTRARWRMPLLLALGAASLSWAWIAELLPLADGVEGTNWVFGHLPWFIAGLLLAELAGILELSDDAQRESAHPWATTISRISSNRPAMLGLFAASYGLACTPLAGPVGLAPLESWQFALKMLLGAIGAYAVLAPLVCSAGPFRFLDSTVMQWLGRWSYGIFIWHLAVLTVVFGLFGIPAFGGHFVEVWLLTAALTVAVSAASYAFVEDPCRRALLAWERRLSVSTPVSTAVPHHSVTR